MIGDQQYNYSAKRAVVLASPELKHLWATMQLMALHSGHSWRPRYIFWQTAQDLWSNELPTITQIETTLQLYNRLLCSATDDLVCSAVVCLQSCCRSKREMVNGIGVWPKQSCLRLQITPFDTYNTSVRFKPIQTLLYTRILRVEPTKSSGEREESDLNRAAFPYAPSDK